MLELIPLYLYVGPYGLPRPDHLYDYVLSTQGLIKRVETRYVSVDYVLVPMTTELIGLHLQPYPLRPLRFKPPRIPGRLLHEIMTDARAQSHLEVMYHLRYSAEQGWSVTRPQQHQASTRVRYTATDPSGIVVDLHSHGTMPAFFSPTDDRDERGGRIYAVIGHLDQPHPQLVLRLGTYGHWLTNVPALTVFEDLGPLLDIYLSSDAYQSDRRPEENNWLTNLFNRRPS